MAVTHTQQIKQLLTPYFSQYAQLSADEIEIIEAYAMIREYPKGAILLKEGQLEFLICGASQIEP